MEAIITEWGLQSYLDLKAKGIFTEQDYREILRPDAELLKIDDPFDTNHPRFSNAKFWGPATNKGQIIKLCQRYQLGEERNGKIEDQDSKDIGWNLQLSGENMSFKTTASQ